MSGPLRCGLIGIGMMGRNHARVLRELPEVELVVIADPAGDPTNLSRGVPVVPSVEDALGFNLDCAVVAVPTKHHETVGIACARAKVPVLIEKPLAPSIESAERIAAAFHANNTIAHVGHIERFNPAIQQLSKRLDSGELGDIFQIATRRQSSFPGRVEDVGVIQDLATHDLDIALLLSSSNYAEIGAFTAHRSGRTHEDMLVASGRMDNGIIVNHVVNWLSPLKERRTVVTGDRGLFVANTITGDLTFHRNGHFDVSWSSLETFRGVGEGDSIRFAFEKTEPLRAELKSFFSAVMGDEVSEAASLSEGMAVIKAVEMVMGSRK